MSEETSDDQGESPIRSVRVLATKVKRDPNLEARLKANPVQTLEALSKGAVDPPPVRMLVIGILGLIVVVCVVGMIALQMYDKTISDALVAIASAAVGALAAVLTGQRVG